MSMWYVNLLFLLFTGPLQAAIPNTSVMGFSDWKNQKIKAAYSNYVGSQKAYEGFKGTVFERNNLYKVAARNHRVLAATRNLSIHDYFQMYLMAQYPDSTSAMESALKSLNDKQVAELLMSYQKSLRG
ncbi:MAG: hypothetical protein KDD37_03525, partial [Bdellovibrionales bacterium]|nr:hypothetical protein [Bdellovibrionales bacterium]